MQEKIEIKTVAEFTLTGQIKSGKNNMGITRSGHRYPMAAWAAWRDEVVLNLRDQSEEKQIRTPCTISFFYKEANKRRRDVPGMIDALFHCLERAGIIKDDSLFKNVYWFNEESLPSPGVRILIKT